MSKKLNLKTIIILIILSYIISKQRGVFMGALTADSIDDNFDSGNAGVVTLVSATEFDMEQILETEPIETGWFNFKLNGVQGDTITFNIVNANEIGDIKDSGSNPSDGKIYSPKQMVYTCDVGLLPSQQTWKYFGKDTDGNGDDIITYSGGVYSVTHTYECNNVQIATYYPYSYTDAMNYINNIVSRTSSMPNAEANVVELGLAEPLIKGKGIYARGERLPVKMLDLTNPNIAESNKRHIYIQGRQHPAETQATWMTMGLIEMVLENQFYLDNFHWYWVPIVEVTGVVDGNSRWVCADGNYNYGDTYYTGCDPWYNSNRQWGRSCATSQVQAIEAKLDEIDSMYGLDRELDWHGWAAGRDCSNNQGEPANTYSYESALSYGLSMDEAGIIAWGGC